LQRVIGAYFRNALSPKIPQRKFGDCEDGMGGTTQLDDFNSKFITTDLHNYATTLYQQNLMLDFQIVGILFSRIQMWNTSINADVWYTFRRH